MKMTFPEKAAISFAGVKTTIFEYGNYCQLSTGNEH